MYDFFFLCPIKKDDALESNVLVRQNSGLLGLHTLIFTLFSIFKKVPLKKTGFVRIEDIEQLFRSRKINNTIIFFIL